VWHLLGVEQIQNGSHCHGGNITAKICEIWSEFKKNLHLGYHGNGRHFEFVQPKKLPYTTVDILTKFHEV
jgi:hypothetical protein